MKYLEYPWLWKITKTPSESMFGPDPKTAFLLFGKENEKILGKIQDQWDLERETLGMPYLACKYCGTKFKQIGNSLMPFDFERALYKKWWICSPNNSV